MKTKVTLTIDENLLPQAKRYARQQKISLSALVEKSLREVTAQAQSSFSSRWRGKFKTADQEDARYDQLVKKYL
jgi:post-segregation antitoxin (ccd killing protein)